ncbi:MAG: sugar transferase, partial [Syntrophotaleaceae bacterium]
RLSLGNIFSRLFHIHFWGGLLVAAMLYLWGGQRLNRSFYLSFLLFSFGLFLIEKILLRRGLGIIRKRGRNSRNLVIVGSGDKALKFHNIIEDHKDWGLKVFGFVPEGESDAADIVDGHRVLGSVDELVEICKANPVDEVVFCLSKEFVDKAEDYFHDLAELGITVRLVLDFFDAARSKREIGYFHDEIPILTFYSKSLDAQQLFVKRLLDVCGACCGLAVLAVMFPFLAVAIKLDAPGPIFFGQKRVGENGRTFTCWKFRSMYIDAEARKQELMAQNEMSGAIFKIKDDPRITRVGRILRKTSLDEFPQFWNVLKGEMSLVGTRPPTPQEVEQYENWHRRRISIRPGITGMWQISGRNQISDFDEIVRLDLLYIDTWNVWQDIKILVKTVRAVFAGSGSC